MFLTCVALATLAVVIGVFMEAERGVKFLERLDEIAPLSGNDLPSVAIVVAARNEEKNIRAGVLSHLHQDYSKLSVIVVDDRSTDTTPKILTDLAQAHASLRVLSVTTLPAGWLGKNHALHLGAQHSDADFVLFSDADVVMDPSTLRRAMRYVHDRQLSHLAIGPAAIMPGVWLNMFLLGFTVFFNLFTRPWRVRDPKSQAHIGIGAFNLVNKAVYASLGGHAQIALRPDDDLKLGKLLKKNGHRSDFLIGAPLISVEWYASVRELVRGLEKNMFAGTDYRLSLVLLGVLGQFWIFQWPWIALFSSSGWVQRIYATVIALLVLTAASAARSQKLPLWMALGLPLASMMFVFILLRTTYVNLRDRGITWRGTFYPLGLLRKNEV